jgi:hypothetical protein
MPHASNVPAIAVWMLLCILFVFSALMCYAFLLWRLNPLLVKKGGGNYERKEEDDILSQADNDNVDPETGSMCHVSTSDGKKGKDSVRRADCDRRNRLLRLDNMFIITFPAIFILLNLVYWSVCLSQAPIDTSQILSPFLEPTDSNQFVYGQE